MKLTPDQRARLGPLLREKVGAFPPCAVCGNATGWSIGGSTIDAEGAGPFVAMSCTKCGHTLLFHASLLGLVEEGA